MANKKTTTAKVKQIGGTAKANPQMSEKELTEKIQLEMKKRAEKCMAEIQPILEQYNCVLDADVLLKQNAVQVFPKVIPL